MSDPPARPSEYLDSNLRLIKPGALRCGFTGQPIPLDQVKYWSVERQEAYSGPEAVLQRLGVKLLSATVSPPRRQNKADEGSIRGQVGYVRSDSLPRTKARKTLLVLHVERDRQREHVAASRSRTRSFSVVTSGEFPASCPARKAARSAALNA